jgi:hypothetical protein
MADNIVLSTSTRAALQKLQQAAAAGLKQAVQSERTVIDLIAESRKQFGSTTAARGKITDILA